MSINGRATTASPPAIIHLSPGFTWRRPYPIITDTRRCVTECYRRSGTRGTARPATLPHATRARGREGRPRAVCRRSADRGRVEREVEVLRGTGRLDDAGLEQQVAGRRDHGRRAEPGGLEHHGGRRLRRGRQDLPGERGGAVGEGEQLHAVGRARGERADTDGAAL